MATPLSLTTDRRDDGTFVVTATGEIDLSNIDSFADALDGGRTGADGATLTVDLSGVEYLDSGAHQRAVRPRRSHSPDRQSDPDAGAEDQWPHRRGHRRIGGPRSD